MNLVRNFVKQCNKPCRYCQWDKISISNGVNYLKGMEVAGILWIMSLSRCNIGTKKEDLFIDL